MFMVMKGHDHHDHDHDHNDDKCHRGATIGEESGLHIELDTLLQSQMPHRIRINQRSVMETTTCNLDSLSKSNPAMKTGLLYVMLAVLQ